MPQCSCPGCGRSCHPRPQGGYHDFCGNTCRNRSCNHSGTSATLTVGSCQCQGCNNPRHPAPGGGFFDYCGNNCRFGACGHSAIRGSCKCPGCERPCHPNPSGGFFDWCGRSCGSGACGRNHVSSSSPAPVTVPTTPPASVPIMDGALRRVDIKGNAPNQRDLINLQISIPISNSAPQRKIHKAIHTVLQEVQGLYRRDSVKITVETGSVTVAVHNASEYCLGAVVGRIQFELHQRNVDTSTTTPLQYPTGERVRRLLVLNLSSRGTNRADCCLKVAHVMIFHAKCAVYGGFVRDYIVGGEIHRVNDIDAYVTMPMDTTLRTLKNLGNVCQYTLRRGNYRTDPKRDVQTIEFNFHCGVKVEADLVLSKDPNVGVDASVNNLKITPFGAICRKSDAPEATHSLSEIIQQIREKKFHFYMAWNNPNYCITRASKLLGKGYACQSGIPPHYRSQFDSRYNNLIM